VVRFRTWAGALERRSGNMVHEAGRVARQSRQLCSRDAGWRAVGRDMERRGATIALYIVAPDGRPYDVYDVEAAAARERISVRSGCFCNPGDGEVAHHISRADMERCFRDPAAAITLLQCQRTIEDKTGKVPNTIRVSLGLASNFPDVYRFRAFAESYRDRVAE